MNFKTTVIETVYNFQSPPFLKVILLAKLNWEVSEKILKAMAA